jgi:Amt family ammonium transporter
MANVDDVALGLDILWLMLGGCLVFFMHSGFALLEVGSVSVRNTQVRTETLVRQHVS